MKLLLTFILLLIGTATLAQVIPIERPEDKNPVVKKTVKKIPVVKSQSVKPAETPQNQFAIPMVYVAGGSFNMGSNNDGDDAKPIHSVTLNSFYMAKTECTLGQFRKFIQATGYKTTAEQEGWSDIWTGSKFDKQNGVTWEYDSFGFKRSPTQEMQPVIHVSWGDAARYCQWLSSQTGKTYRLPTEAEWEYAAKGGNKSLGYAYSGSNKFEDVGWCLANCDNQTHPVAQKQANELGFYDLTGNVVEWCSDWYDKDYYSNSPETNPAGPASGTARVRRGGGWSFSSSFCHVARRFNLTPDAHNYNLGFRPVLVP